MLRKKQREKNMNFNNIIDPNKHYTVVHFVSVQMGNPNGDPLFDNRPRTFSDRSGDTWGILSSVSIKRKIRDTVGVLKGRTDGFKLFIDNDKALNDKIADSTPDADRKTKVKSEDALKTLMATYYDNRMFGGVFNTGDFPAGTGMGALQLNDYRSITPIQVEELQVSRKAVTTTKDFEKGNQGTFGNKYIVPFGIYKGVMNYHPVRGMKNGVTEEDLKVLWQSLAQMFDVNMSASRGLMATHALAVFSQDAEGPYFQSKTLSDLVNVTPLTDGPWLDSAEFTLNVREDLLQNYPGVNLTLF